MIILFCDSMKYCACFHLLMQSLPLTGKAAGPQWIQTEKGCACPQQKLFGANPTLQECLEPSCTAVWRWMPHPVQHPHQHREAGSVLFNCLVRGVVSAEGRCLVSFLCSSKIAFLNTLTTLTVLMLALKHYSDIISYQNKSTTPCRDKKEYTT